VTDDTTQLDLEAAILDAQGLGLLPDWLARRARRAGLVLPKVKAEGVRVPPCFVPVPVEMVEQARRAAGLCGRSPVPRVGEHQDEEEESDGL
jgi:hypothetical protein